MSTPHALRSPRVLLAVEALEQRELPDAGWLGSLTSHFQVDPNAAASDRVLVKFRASLESLAGPAAPADFTGLAIGYGMRLGSALNMVEGLYSVQLTGVTVHQALAAFAGNPLVTYVQPDFEIRVERLPNDPNFGSQYALRNTGQWMGVPGADINAETAWDYTTGSGNIVVAVLDTGINYNHPDLAANMWINPGEAQGSAYASSVYGWNFVNNTANPMDDHGHGTHVAGIIGAVGDNGIGVSGVAWNVQLMALKVLNYAGSGFTSSAIQAINFAATRGAHIANASWGGAPYDPALANAINQARAHGMIFVAAAGNQSRNIDVNPFYPASYDFDNMVRVAATDNRDLFASFSNWGPNTVQLAAPGWNILSTSRFGGYVTSSGTSMSAPMVAGALALVWDHNPTWNYQQVIAQVLGTVDPLPSLATRVSTGGRLNVGRALAESPGGGPGGGGSNGGLPGNPPGGGTGGPVQSGSWITGVTSLTSGNSINGFRVTFNSAIQASTFTLADVTQATGPNGNLNLLGVAPVAGSSTQFDITFSPQSAAGTYRCTIGPNVLNLAGVAMDQNQNGVAGEVPGD
ncbi:MAG TPA: S8 family peptidase, partial [Gemmatales bacterium]|nr:S8 family peptidase [Gemmatales bacterium]